MDPVKKKKKVIYKKNNSIVGFDSKGHAGYAEMGADIVCSAVSSLVQNAEICLSEVMQIKISLNRNDKNAVFCLRIAKSESEENIKKAQPILESIEISLKRIEQEYKKYLKVEVENEIV